MGSIGTYPGSPSPNSPDQVIEPAQPSSARYRTIRPVPDDKGFGLRRSASASSPIAHCDEAQRQRSVRGRFTAGLEGYGGRMRGHRNQVDEGARREARQEVPEEGASDTSDPQRASDGLPTGEEQAATNREEDPPA